MTRDGRWLDACSCSYMRLIEHWGSGIPRIIAEVREARLREPEFLGGDTDLRINIYRQSDVVRDTEDKVPDTAFGVPDTEDSLSAGQCAAYRYVREHGEVTADEIGELLGVQDRRARKILSELVARGLLRRIGAARSTRYVLPDALTPSDDR